MSEQGSKQSKRTFVIQGTLVIFLDNTSVFTVTASTFFSILSFRKGRVVKSLKANIRTLSSTSSGLLSPLLLTLNDQRIHSICFLCRSGLLDINLVTGLFVRDWHEMNS